MPYVIKLDAIVNNIADKRTLRALIIADPNQQGIEIIMLEADPLVFYGGKMPNARNLKWFNQVQFVRYSETNAQEKKVIDHYLATIKKEYHPQDEDALLAAESVPGVLSLPLARFNAPLSEDVSLAFTAKEVSIPRYDGIHIDIKSDSYGNTTRKCSLGRGRGSIPVVYDTDWETWRKITDTIVMKKTGVTSKKQLGDPIWPDLSAQWKSGSYADFQQIKNQLPIAINNEIITLGSISSVPPAQATLIPQQIHYIWVGDLIPENLLENITKNVENSPQYQSIIHVDADSSNIFKEIEQKIKSKLDDKVSNIEIRDLHEDNFFLNFRNTESGEMYQHFRAGIGKNYSATADVLRYSLVDEHGGIYLDTDDTIVRHVHGIQLKAMPNDILLNGVVTHEPTFFKGHNTSCFASQPNNPVLKEMIKEMNQRYKANASFFATPRPYIIPGQPRGISGEFNNYQKKIFEITGPKMFDDVLRQQRPDYYFLDKLHEKQLNFSSGVVSKEYTAAAKNACDYYFPFGSMFFEVKIGAEQSMQHTR